MNWDDFKNEVLPYVPGCPWAMAKDHVIKAAREFSANTFCIEASFSFDTVADQSAYVLTTETGLEIIKLLRVEVGGVEYPVANGFTGRAMGRANCSRVATLNMATRTVTLSPAPSQAGIKCYVDAAVKPTANAATCPDALAQYVQDIAPGAIASLCAMPKKDWTSFDSSVMHGKKFKDRIATVGINTTFGNGSQKLERTARFW